MCRSTKVRRGAHRATHRETVNPIKSTYYNGNDPQMSRPTNRQAEPEVWFRIVHLGQNSNLLAPYPEHTVDVALGPNEMFESDNMA